MDEIQGVIVYGMLGMLTPLCWAACLAFLWAMPLLVQRRRMVLLAQYIIAAGLCGWAGWKLIFFQPELYMSMDAKPFARYFAAGIVGFISVIFIPEIRRYTLIRLDDRTKRRVGGSKRPK
jgi:hypothetical protein